MNNTEAQYAIYVNQTNSAHCGYLAAGGGITKNRSDAASFDSMEAAKAHIAFQVEHYGWVDSTSVVTGKVSAYVCCLY